jgi:membrane protein DedA with SNARE-associated domain
LDDFLKEFLQDYGYVGIFLGIVATGLGLPMPEELPVVIGGILVGHGLARWYFMLPVCIVAVIIGDSFLYLIGRFYGPRLLTYRWVQKRLLPPERLESIAKNFARYGVRILLFARMTPGIRAPIFLTAGLIRLPLTRFVMADSIYAVPGVSLLFFLGFWFGDSVLGIVDQVEEVKSYIVLVLVVVVALYLAYRFLRKPMLTGDPKEMPPLVGPVTNTVEQVANKIMHPLTPSGEVARAPYPGTLIDGQTQPPTAAPPGEVRDAGPPASPPG